MKVCTKCKVEKTLEGFHKDKSRSDGISVWCKDCKKPYRDARYCKDRHLELQRSKKWHVDNPQRSREMYSAKGKRRRARKYSADTRAVSRSELSHLLTRPCLACGTHEAITVEHLIPLARGGRHAIGNLAPLCQTCNSSKGSMLWIEWRASNRPRALEVFDSLGGTCVS